MSAILLTAAGCYAAAGGMVLLMVAATHGLSGRPILGALLTFALWPVVVWWAISAYR